MRQRAVVFRFGNRRGKNRLHRHAPEISESEQLYINTILKLSYYFHALSRFDKPTEEREKDNLIVLFADEGREIITGAESAFADHRAAGVIREARAAIVLATQAYTSIHGSLDKRHADVLMLNLSNELIFTRGEPGFRRHCLEEHRRAAGSRRKIVGMGRRAKAPTTTRRKIEKPFFRMPYQSA